MRERIREITLPVSAAAITWMAWASSALAVGVGGPVPDYPGSVTATTTAAFRTAITNALLLVLSFLALVAVVIIVIAGIRLIVSQGEEEAKDKAKKTIFYAILGLIVILFARAIVAFFAGLGGTLS